MTPSEQAVRYLCQHVGVGFKTAELHEKFGGSKDTMSNALLAALRDGFLRRETTIRNASIWYGVKPYVPAQTRPPEFGHGRLEPFGRSAIPEETKKLTARRTWMQI